MSSLPAGRRIAEKNEHLFLGPTRKHRHFWIATEREHSGPVVACGVCGKIKRGETLPITWEAVTR